MNAVPTYKSVHFGHIPNSNIWLKKIITALIGVIEGKSLFENLYRITKVDFLNIVITKLQMIGDRLHPTSEKDTQDVYTGKKDEKKKQKQKEESKY